jgi:hypothetical protein
LFTPSHCAVHIVGTVVEAIGCGVPSGYCRWRFVTGSDWSCVEGEMQGHSHVAVCDEVRWWGGACPPVRMGMPYP